MEIECKVSSSAINKLQVMAYTSPNKEICGLIDIDQNIYPIENVSKYPNTFIFNKAQYFKLLNRLRKENILCIYHSHLVNTLASEKDHNSSCNLGYDYLIITPTDYRWVPYA